MTLAAIDMNPYKNHDLRKFISSIPQEEVERQTKLQEENNKRVYEEFISALKAGMCFLCKAPINTFDESRMCFHWFTYPNGIKKKHFDKYLKTPLSFFRLDSYFRWLANTEKPIGNINDLKAETSSTSFLETTIRYKNIEWAFSIGHTDKSGHEGTHLGATPHYHLQMKVNGNVFLRFNDYHIRFTDEDLFTLELLEQASDKFAIGHHRGHGISIIEDEQNLPLIDELMSLADNEDEAPFHTQTLVQAPEGQTFSGEFLEMVLEESKRTKTPFRHVLKKYMPDAKTTTIINPGDGVPDMTKRSGKK